MHKTPIQYCIIILRLLFTAYTTCILISQGFEPLTLMRRPYLVVPTKNTKRVSMLPKGVNTPRFRLPLFWRSHTKHRILPHLQHEALSFDCYLSQNSGFTNITHPNPGPWQTLSFPKETLRPGD